jgi:hypothetical protein
MNRTYSEPRRQLRSLGRIRLVGRGTVQLDRSTRNPFDCSEGPEEKLRLRGCSLWLLAAVLLSRVCVRK